MSYRSKTLRALCPVSFIAIESGTPARTRLRTCAADREEIRGLHASVVSIAEAAVREALDG